MKIICEREKLLTAVQMAASVAPSRSPKAILQNVKVVASEAGTELLATDLEIGMRVQVPGIKTESPGSAVLHTARFTSLLRESSDDKLSIEADHRGATIRGTRSEFNWPMENPDEFPEISRFEEERYHDVAARLFRELIRRTLFAADTESSRYALAGVLLEFEPERITAVGTDGRRLAKMEGPARSVQGHANRESITIVPSRSMLLIERALSDADAEVQIAARANDLLVRTQRATIYTRLVEGRFPKWREVFPVRQNAARIVLAVGPMYQALRQAAIVASDESRGIDFSFGDNTLVLSGRSANVGQSRVELPIGYDGPKVTVTLDHRYVSDFLRVLDPEKNLTLEIENDESAALLTTDDGYGYVIMPLARDNR